MEQVLAGVAAIFPGPYLHIGADEPRGMPDEDYVSYVRRLRRLVRSLGRQPLGWQESARAGLGPDDVVQYWLTGIDLPPSVPPQVRAQVEAEVALSRRDAEAVAAASVPVIASPLGHCYLDVPYADPAGRWRCRCRAGGPARPPRPARLRAQDHRRVVPVGARRNARAGPGRAGRRRRGRDLGRNHLRLRRPVLPPAAPPARRRPPGLERPAARRLGRPPRPPRPARPAVGPGRPHLLPRRHRGLGLAPQCRPGPRSSSSSKNPPICRSRSTRWTSRIQWQAWPFRSVRRIGLSLPGAM